MEDELSFIDDGEIVDPGESREDSRKSTRYRKGESGKLAKSGDWTMEIVKRSDTAKGFEIIPRRWVVERTFAWLNRCRRLAKDWEKTIASAEAWITIAHIRLVTRRLARYCYVS